MVKIINFQMIISQKQPEMKCLRLRTTVEIQANNFMGKNIDKCN